MTKKHNDQVRKVFVSPWILNYIKKHAKSSPHEIYGWLIGREWGKDSLFIISTIGCQRYLQQTAIGAKPDPLEVQELNRGLPIGWGKCNVGGFPENYQ